MVHEGEGEGTQKEIAIVVSLFCVIGKNTSRYCVPHFFLFFVFFTAAAAWGQKI